MIHHTLFRFSDFCKTCRYFYPLDNPLLGRSSLASYSVLNCLYSTAGTIFFYFGWVFCFTLYLCCFSFSISGTFLAIFFLNVFGFLVFYGLIGISSSIFFVFAIFPINMNNILFNECYLKICKFNEGAYGKIYLC